MKWNESDSRPLLCTYRLNWAVRTSWGWWDEWDDTALQTQDSKFKPWRSEGTLPLGHGGSPQYWVLRVDGEEFFCLFQTAEIGKWTPNSGVKESGANHYPFKPPRKGNEPRTLAWKAAVLTTTLGPPPKPAVSRHIKKKIVTLVLSCF